MPISCMSNESCLVSLRSEKQNGPLILTLLQVACPWVKEWTAETEVAAEEEQALAARFQLPVMMKDRLLNGRRQAKREC